MGKAVMMEIVIHLDVSGTVTPIKLMYTSEEEGAVVLSLTLADSGRLCKMLERAELAFQALADSHSEKGKGEG